MRTRMTVIILGFIVLITTTCLQNPTPKTTLAARSVAAPVTARTDSLTTALHAAVNTGYRMVYTARTVRSVITTTSTTSPPPLVKPTSSIPPTTVVHPAVSHPVPPTTSPSSSTSGAQPTVTPLEFAEWSRVAKCEEGGRWNVQGDQYSGIGFLNTTWIAEGGLKYAPNAGLATPDEQILIAEKVEGYSGYVPDQGYCASW
jgi:hypothetical protein